MSQLLTDDFAVYDYASENPFEYLQQLLEWCAPPGTDLPRCIEPGSADEPGVADVRALHAAGCYPHAWPVPLTRAGVQAANEQAAAEAALDSEAVLWEALRLGLYGISPTPPSGRSSATPGEAGGSTAGGSGASWRSTPLLPAESPAGVAPLQDASHAASPQQGPASAVAALEPTVEQPEQASMAVPAPAARAETPAAAAGQGAADYNQSVKEPQPPPAAVAAEQQAWDAAAVGAAREVAGQPLGAATCGEQPGERPAPEPAEQAAPGTAGCPAGPEQRPGSAAGAEPTAAGVPAASTHETRGTAATVNPLLDAAEAAALGPQMAEEWAARPSSPADAAKHRQPLTRQQSPAAPQQAAAQAAESDSEAGAAKQRPLPAKGQVEAAAAAVERPNSRKTAGKQSIAATAAEAAERSHPQPTAALPLQATGRPANSAAKWAEVDGWWMRDLPRSALHKRRLACNGGPGCSPSMQSFCVFKVCLTATELATAVSAVAPVLQ